MNLIKQILHTVVNLAIGPFLNLRKIKTMTVGETVVNAVGIVTRVTVAASFFVAVPALAVKLSLLWIFGGFILAAGFMLLGLLGVVSFFGYAAAQAKKDEAANDAAPVAQAA